MVWTVLVLAMLLLLLAVVAFVCFMTSTHDTFKKLNIDSPPTSWFLGNFDRIIKYGAFQGQLQFYNQYKDKKVYGLYYSRRPTLVVRDLDMVKDVLVKSFNNFVNHNIHDFDGIIKDNIFFIKDDHWRRVRNIVSPAFSSGRIKTMSQFVERRSKKLVELLQAKMERNEDVELKNLNANFVMELVAGTGYGLDINSMENPNDAFTVHTKQLFNVTPLTFAVVFIAPMLQKYFSMLGISLASKESTEFFDKTTDSVIKNKKENRNAGNFKDFIDLLIDAEVESGQPEKSCLTRSEIHAQAVAFVFGAFDTTSSVLAFTLFLLAHHPEICQKVQKEIDEHIGNDSPNYDNIQGLTYLDMCINESIRMYPPNNNLERICREDMTIQGVHIPKNMTVLIPIYAIHQDPEIWPEPEKFQPERFSVENKESRHPYAHIPFGYGPRACIGMRLAIVKLRITLASVLKNLTPIPCEKTVYPAKLKQLILHAEDGLWVKFEKRNKL